MPVEDDRQANSTEIDNVVTDGAPNPALNLRRRDRDMLIIATVVVAFAFLLKVEEPRVRLAVWPGLLIPESCFARTYYEVDCPGCGLTRSFIYLADGELQKSLHANRVGWILALSVLLQIPFRILSIRNDGRFISIPVRRAMGWSIVIILISNWVYNLFV